MTTTAMGEIVQLLQMATDKAKALDGRNVPQPEHGRNRARELSDIQKSLLHLAHLCDKSRVLVLDQYHAVRGFSNHLESGGQP